MADPAAPVTIQIVLARVQFQAVAIDANSKVWPYEMDPMTIVGPDWPDTFAGGWAAAIKAAEDALNAKLATPVTSAALGAPQASAPSA